ncbi:MAG: sigma-54 dependent transcriptional regulator [Melioribacteraceae bacterium]|nr:sigma-54 dependent transcriptional regulator [Melioribacteraceae bacterium]MCF8355793.1 sigma-54 dependent transcriptional regulator [Melioribacteraceae bacterium]MCF8392817.1 sigma-54 dependent transcriptional regulator [Melioribacteraceae bacterium]MCF8418697.1 sigma-54 dependent transcriptional regulator [Melioribacteraceae bacterium]
MTIEEFQKKFEIVGKSKEIKDLVDITMQVAQSDISVLLYGESGVGKEIFARAIHGFSNRSENRLVSVNCGAIPEGILESELFGHVKGSFTGATDNRKGYFEIADNGTLFLDEIAEMPLTTQVKLLRALETKEFMRIGSERVTNVDVRIIAATNKDLQHEVDAKRFRKDLYFRLKAVSLNIPPLRNRREDIPLLVDYFIKKYADSNNHPEMNITSKALDILCEHNWPGNIRELKNTIETAAALSRNGTLDQNVLMPLITHWEIIQEDHSQNLPVHLKRPPDSLDREMIYRALIEIKKDILELKDLAYKHGDNIENLGSEINLNEVIPLDQLEKKAIENALNFTRWNKRKAAQLLKVSERTLHRKIKDYDL